MKFLQSTLAMTAAVLLLCAPRAQAQGWDGPQREHAVKDREAHVEQIYSQLNLSVEQRKMLQENKRRHKTATQNLSKDMKNAMDAMGEELKKKDLDMNKIMAMKAEIKNLHDQIVDERFNSILEVRKILTYEQFTKFIELVRDRKRHEEAEHAEP